MSYKHNPGPGAGWFWLPWLFFALAGIHLIRLAALTSGP